jgi:hypothetical protein
MYSLSTADAQGLGERTCTELTTPRLALNYALNCDLKVPILAEKEIMKILNKER